MYCLRFRLFLIFFFLGLSFTIKNCKNKPIMDFGNENIFMQICNFYVLVFAELELCNH